MPRDLRPQPPTLRTYPSEVERALRFLGSTLKIVFLGFTVQGSGGMSLVLIFIIHVKQEKLNFYGTPKS